MAKLSASFVSMVLLCLIAGKNARRCNDPQPLPFQNGKHARRQIRREVKSEKISSALQDRQLSALGGLDPYIYGMVDVSVGFAYSHSARISELEREQYWYWRSMGVSPTDLWCFHIERAAALPEPLAARQYIPKRFSRVYTVVNCISMREISAECTEVPDWMDSELSREEGEEDGMHVAAMFPEEVVMLCVHKALDVLILPSPHSQGWWTPAGWLRRRFNPDLQHAFEAARAHLIRPDVELCHAFHLQDCGQLAEDLRFCLESGLPGQEQILAQWVGHLQEREDSMQMYSRSDRLAVFMQMIELVMLAEKIRNTADLRDVMQRSLRIVLPEDLHELAANMLQNKVQKFDKGRVSRAHLTIDAGFMLQQRIYNRTSPDQLRYLMWDSSPQFGRDYQMCLLQSVAKSDLPSILQNLVQLCQLREDDDAINFDDDAVLEQEQMLMSDLRSKIRTHALPTVLIGFGAATFQRKLRALLHSARLEVFTKEDLAPWCESLVSVASDYGVEHLLSDVRGLPAETATCWFQDTDSADIQLLLNGPRGSDLPGPRQAVDQAREAHANFDAEGFEDPHAAPAAVDMQLLAGPIAEEDFELPPQVQLNFEHLLSVPGLLHVIDNATKGLGDVMQRYEDNIALAQQVCRLLRKRDSKPKLLERCFSRGVGAQLASDIREFQGWIHPGRWGTVVFSIPELLKVKHALVSCWDERVYLQGNDAVADEGRRQDAMNLAADVTKAVSDPAWWGWLSMLEVVCSLLRKHTFWAESCPCHSHILQSNRGELTAELKQHFERCPLRGKRAPELSAGEFLELLGQLWRAFLAKTCCACSNGKQLTCWRMACGDVRCLLVLAQHTQMCFRSCCKILSANMGITASNLMFVRREGQKGKLACLQWSLLVFFSGSQKMIVSRNGCCWEKGRQPSRLATVHGVLTQRWP